MDHFRVTFKPDNKSIVIHAGAAVLEAAAQTGIILNSPCGGKGICKKCRVKLLPEDKDVLACQYRIVSDVEVMVPL
ncbi:MAG TPA: 2Fe-2S iron-sulfur cluster-binding protein, partial [Methylococcales bacterium]